MKINIKRYGLHLFGHEPKELMAEYKDGEWCKYKDVLDLVVKLVDGIKKALSPTDVL